MTHAVLFSFSRGGMLGLCVVAAATAYLIPKTQRNLGLMALGVIVGLSMAGPEVVERFGSMTNTQILGASEEEADWSAEESNRSLEGLLDDAREDPVFGKGPDHFPLLVDRYPVDGNRFPHGKEAHTMWLQIAAELGLPGLFFLAAYFGFTVAGLWPYLKLDRSDSLGLTPGATARMVVAAMSGYIVSAQFVSLEGLEFPYYVALVGVASLKLSSPVPHPGMSLSPARQPFAPAARPQH